MRLGDYSAALASPFTTINGCRGRGTRTYKERPGRGVGKNLGRPGGGRTDRKSVV